MSWLGETNFSNRNERRECSSCRMFEFTYKMKVVKRGESKEYYCRTPACQEKARQVAALVRATDREERDHRVAARALAQMINAVVANVNGQKKVTPSRKERV